MPSTRKSARRRSRRASAAPVLMEVPSSGLTNPRSGMPPRRRVSVVPASGPGLPGGAVEAARLRRPIHRRPVPLNAPRRLSLVADASGPAPAVKPGRAPRRPSEGPISPTSSRRSSVASARTADGRLMTLARRLSLAASEDKQDPDFVAIREHPVQQRERRRSSAGVLTAAAAAAAAAAAGADGDAPNSSAAGIRPDDLPPKSLARRLSRSAASDAGDPDYVAVQEHPVAQRRRSLSAGQASPLTAPPVPPVALSAPIEGWAGGRKCKDGAYVNVRIIPAPGMKYTVTATSVGVARESRITVTRDEIVEATGTTATSVQLPADILQRFADTAICVDGEPPPPRIRVTAGGGSPRRQDDGAASTRSPAGRKGPAWTGGRRCEDGVYVNLRIAPSGDSEGTSYVVTAATVGSAAVTATKVSRADILQATAMPAAAGYLPMPVLQKFMDTAVFVQAQNPPPKVVIGPKASSGAPAALPGGATPQRRRSMPLDGRRRLSLVSSDGAADAAAASASRRDTTTEPEDGAPQSTGTSEGAGTRVGSASGTAAQPLAVDTKPERGSTERPNARGFDGESHATEDGWAGSRLCEDGSSVHIRMVPGTGATYDIIATMAGGRATTTTPVTREHIASATGARFGPGPVPPGVLQRFCEEFVTVHASLPPPTIVVSSSAAPRAPLDGRRRMSLVSTAAEAESAPNLVGWAGGRKTDGGSFVHLRIVPTDPSGTRYEVIATAVGGSAEASITITRSDIEASTSSPAGSATDEPIPAPLLQRFVEECVVVDSADYAPCRITVASNRSPTGKTAVASPDSVASPRTVRRRRDVARQHMSRSKRPSPLSPRHCGEGQEGDDANVTVIAAPASPADALKSPTTRALERRGSSRRLGPLQPRVFEETAPGGTAPSDSGASSAVARGGGRAGVLAIRDSPRSPDAARHFDFAVEDGVEGDQAVVPPATGTEGAGTLPPVSPVRKPSKRRPKRVHTMDSLRLARERQKEAAAERAAVRAEERRKQREADARWQPMSKEEALAMGDAADGAPNKPLSPLSDGEAERVRALEAEVERTRFRLKLARLRKSALENSLNADEEDGQSGTDDLGSVPNWLSQSSVSLGTDSRPTTAPFTLVSPVMTGRAGLRGGGSVAADDGPLDLEKLKLAAAPRPAASVDTTARLEAARERVTQLRDEIDSTAAELSRTQKHAESLAKISVYGRTKPRPSGKADRAALLDEQEAVRSQAVEDALALHRASLDKLVGDITTMIKAPVERVVASHALSEIEFQVKNATLVLEQQQKERALAQSRPSTSSGKPARGSRRRSRGGTSSGRRPKSSSAAERPSRAERSGRTDGRPARDASEAAAGGAGGRPRTTPADPGRTKTIKSLASTSSHGPLAPRAAVSCFGSTRKGPASQVAASFGFGVRPCLDFRRPWSEVDVPLRKPQSSFGRQALSDYRSGLAPYFGEDTREQANKVYISEEAEMMRPRDNLSPGPVYAMPDTIGPQHLSTHRNAPAVSFGAQGHVHVSRWVVGDTRLIPKVHLDPDVNYPDKGLGVGVPSFSLGGHAKRTEGYILPDNASPGPKYAPKQSTKVPGPKMTVPLDVPSKEIDFVPPAWSQPPLQSSMGKQPTTRPGAHASFAADFGYAKRPENVFEKFMPK